MSKILYFLKESVVSSRRNLGTTIGGIVTIFLSLLMIGVTIIISIMIGNLASSFEDEVNVRLYIADEAIRRANSESRQLSQDPRERHG